MATLCVMPPMLDLATAYELNAFLHWLTLGLRRLIIQSAKDPFWCFDRVGYAFGYSLDYLYAVRKTHWELEA